MLPGRWRDYWTGVRNRILLDPRFQKLAASLPGGRSATRRHARAVFDLCSGFIYSQTLLAVVRCNLIQSLTDQPRSSTELAKITGLTEGPLARLLVAAEGIDLIERRHDGTYTLAATGAALMANAHLLPMIRHHAVVYEDLIDPLNALTHRGSGKLAQYWAYAGNSDAQSASPEAVADYSALMAATQTMVATEALRAYPFERHTSLLDVGGGTGAFATAVHSSAPKLDVGVFDLPGVIQQNAGTGSPIQWHGGNFFSGPLPTGSDLISLVRILHDHDDEPCAHLLSNVHNALPDRGRLLIVEPLADTPGAQSVGTYFTFYLAAMGTGRPRTLAEIADMARAAGFSDIRRHRNPLPLITSVISARK